MNDHAEPAYYDLKWLDEKMFSVNEFPTENQEDYFLERVALAVQDIDENDKEALEKARVIVYNSMISSKIL